MQCLVCTRGTASKPPKTVKVKPILVSLAISIESFGSHSQILANIPATKALSDNQINIIFCSTAAALLKQHTVTMNYQPFLVSCQNVTDFFLGLLFRHSKQQQKYQSDVDSIGSRAFKWSTNLNVSRPTERHVTLTSSQILSETLLILGAMGHFLLMHFETKGKYYLGTIASLCEVVCVRHKTIFIMNFLCFC